LRFRQVRLASLLGTPTCVLVVLGRHWTNYSFQPPSHEFLTP
jgi:hypothetical protein